VTVPETEVLDDGGLISMGGGDEPVHSWVLTTTLDSFETQLIGTVPGVPKGRH
jgi:hypothetical protein